MELQSKIDLILSFDVEDYLQWHSLFYIDVNDKKYDELEEKEIRLLERKVMRVQELKYDFINETTKILPEYDFKKLSHWEMLNGFAQCAKDELSDLGEHENRKKITRLNQLIKMWLNDIDESIVKKLSIREPITFNIYSGDIRSMRESLGKMFEKIQVIQDITEYIKELQEAPTPSVSEPQTGKYKDSKERTKLLAELVKRGFEGLTNSELEFMIGQIIGVSDRTIRNVNFRNENQNKELFEKTLKKTPTR